MLRRERWWGLARRVVRAALLAVAGAIALGALAVVVLALYFDDARLTELTERWLTEHLAGRFCVAAVRWRLPLRFSIEGLAIESPGREPLLSAAKLGLAIDTVALLSGRLRIGTATGEDILLDAPGARPAGAAPFGLLEAFGPRSRSSGSGGGFGSGGADLEAGQVRLSGVRIRGALPSGATLGPLVIRTEEVACRRGAQGRIESMRAGEVAVFGPGLSLEASGQVRALAPGDPFAAELRVSADVGAGWLRAALGWDGQAQGHLRLTGLASGTVDHLTVTLAGTGADLRVNDAPIETLSAVLAKHGPRIALEHFDLTVGMGTLHATGSIDPGSPRPYRGAVTLRRLPIARLLAAGPAMARSAWPETLDGTVHTDAVALAPLAARVHGHLEARVPILRPHGIAPDIKLIVDAQVSGQRVWIRALQASSRGLGVRISGSVPLSASGPIDLCIRAGATGSAIGPLVRRLEVPVRLHRVALALHARGTSQAPRLTGTLMARAALHGALPVSVVLPLRFSGGQLVVRDGRATLPQGAIRIFARAALPRAGLPWFQRPRLEPPRSEAPRSGALRSDPGRFDPRAVRFAVALSLPHLPLAPWAGGGVRGSLSATVAVTGTGRAFTAVTHAEAAPLVVRGATVARAALTLRADRRASGSAALTATVSIAGLEVSGRPVPAGHGSLAFALDTARHEYRLEASLLDSVRAHAVVLAGPKGWLRPASGEAGVVVSDLALETLLPELEARHVAVHLAGRAHLTFGADRRSLQGGLTLTKLWASAQGRAIQAAGPVEVELAGPTLLIRRCKLEGPEGTFELGGRVGETLALTLHGALDLGVLPSILPQVSDASGALAVAVSLTGRAEAPVLRGHVGIGAPVDLRARGEIRWLRLVALDAALAPGVLSIRELRGVLGAGLVAVSGDVRLAGLTPAAYDLRFRGEQLSLQRGALSLTANLDLLARGTGPSPTLSGTVELLRGRYQRKFELGHLALIARAPPAPAVPAGSAELPPAIAAATLDVRAVTNGPVALKLDAFAFGADAGVTAAVTIRGTVAEPWVEGQARLVSGQIVFPAASLALSGAVNFLPQPGAPVRPLLEVVAQGPVAGVGPDGWEATYDVSLRLKGPLEGISFEMSAPDLTDQLQVLSLLLSGQVNLFAGMPGGVGGLAPWMAIAGAQLAAPLSSYLEQHVLRALNLHFNLRTQVRAQGFRLLLAQDFGPRIQVEGAVGRSFTDAAVVASTSASVLVLERLRVEGRAATSEGPFGTLSDPSVGAGGQLALKFRFLGKD